MIYPLVSFLEWESWESFVAAGASLVLGFMFALLTDSNDRIKQKKREEIFKQLCKGFNSEIAFDESDIRRRYRKNSNLFASYVSFMEDFLDFLQNTDYSEVHEPQKINTFLKEIINREQATQPYEEIDEKERRSLLAIESAITDDALKVMAKNNLSDLSASIQKKDGDLKRAKRTNAWSIPLAVISLVFTILSFFLGTRLSKKDFDEMEKRITTVIENKFTSTSSSETIDLPGTSE